MEKVPGFMGGTFMIGTTRAPFGSEPRAITSCLEDVAGQIGGLQLRDQEIVLARLAVEVAAINAAARLRVEGRRPASDR
jgi:hypothetical protein